MRKIRRRMAFLLSLTLILTAAASPALAAGNWTTRGGNDQRTSSANDVFGWLGPRYSFAVDTGLSASQALNVDNVVYHMGGNEIWMIDPVEAAQRPSNHRVPPAPDPNPGVKLLTSGINSMAGGEVRPSSSGITFKEVGGQKFLFFGTGNNQVCSLNVTALHGDVANPGLPPARRCVQLWGEEPITAVPLVFTTVVNGIEQDIVIMSDKAGYVWAIQNLSGVVPGSYITAREYLGGWVTASPAATGHLEFITAADGVAVGGSNGKVEKFTIQPANPVTGATLDLVSHWGNRGLMPYGIADGMVVDGDYAYLLDTKGNLFRFYLPTGDYNMLPWNEVLPGTTGVFANQAAAVDDERVYFTYRFVDTPYPGGRPSGENVATHPGAVVAVNKADWSVAWAKKLRDHTDGKTSAANTTPVLLKNDRLLLVGGMDGTLWTLDPESGWPYAINQIDKGDPVGCWPASRIPLLTDEGMLPYEAQETYQQLNGSGTEPSVAYVTDADGKIVSFLTVGANFKWAPGYGSGTGGRLMGFRGASTYNVSVLSAHLVGEADTLLDRRLNGEIKPWEVTDADEVLVEAGKKYFLEAEFSVTGMRGSRDMLVVVYFTDAETRQTQAIGRTYLRVVNGRFLNNETTTKLVIELTPPASFTKGNLDVVVNPEDLAHLVSFVEAARQYFPPGEAETMAIMEFVAVMDKMVAAGNQPGEPLFTRCRASEYPEFELGTNPNIMDLLDNLLYVPLSLTGTDLAISVKAPKAVKYQKNGKYTVEFTVENKAGKPLTTEWIAWLDGSIIESGTAAWNPGTSGNTYSVSVPMNGPGRVQEIKVEVNPTRMLQEKDYNNNAATATTSISPEAIGPGWTPDPTTPGGPADIWEGGDDEGVLVPRDCSINDDPTDKRPCNNYGNIVSPWYCANNPGAPECRGYTPGGIWYEIP